MSNIFIPERIQVGFQERKDTYTGKLAYVIYFDAKGVLRKEVSWKGWRDEKIDALIVDNKPQDGFILNKGIQRFNWSHFGSNRSYIRIYDSRGIEFEITPENLIGILTETNCNKRGLDGEFVYAWKGKELVLLPCNSEEYKKATEYTALQSQKISARDLKPGCSYTTKQGEEVIYVGRFEWFEWNSVGYYSDQPSTRTNKKRHIFYSVKEPSKYRSNDRFFYKSSVSFLAVINNEDPVQNYANIIDEWNSDIRSSDVKKIKTKKFSPTVEKIFEVTKEDKRMYLKRTHYTSREGSMISFWRIQSTENYRGHWHGNRVDHESEDTKYCFDKTGDFDTENMIFKSYENELRNRYPYYSKPTGYSKQEIAKMLQDDKFVEINIVLESGKSLSLKNRSHAL